MIAPIQRFLINLVLLDRLIDNGIQTLCWRMPDVACSDIRHQPPGSYDACAFSTGAGVSARYACSTSSRT